jgi:spore germination cell wall hydrolase CwlJ-like protein
MRAHLLAFASKGDLTDQGLRAAFADMDPAMRVLAERFTTGSVELSPTDPPVAVQPQVLPSQAFETLAPDEARLINAAVPFSSEINRAARPFTLSAEAETRARALHCLTEAVYYEAAFEPVEGKRAVAQVVLNRLRHPLYPKTVCGVVFQGSQLRTGCQFTFTCDGSLAKPPVAWAWKESEVVAEQALSGHVAKSVGAATHYHADYVAPYWLTSLSKVAKIGTHIFYRWPGRLGEPQTFNGVYAGYEAPPAEAGATLAGETEAPRDPGLVLAAIGGPIEAVEPRVAAPAPRLEAEAVKPAALPGAELDLPELKQRPAQPRCTSFGGGALDFGGFSAPRCGGL